MSNPNILIGWIAEPSPKMRADREFFRRRNNAVLETLPADDEWPPLCRSLFSVTGDDSLHGSFREKRLIHFAGHFNHFDQSLDEWLDKFEGLLRQLFWGNAELYLLGSWSVPDLQIRYSVKMETAGQWVEADPKPPQEWDITGLSLTREDAEPGDFVHDFLARRARGEP